MSRPNPWPIGITIVYGAFAVAIVGFAAWAVMHQHFDLVAKDYYAQEIAYQDRIDAANRAQALAHHVQLERVDDALRLTVAAPLRGAFSNGSITLYRPSDADLDLDFPVQLDPDGSFEVDTAPLLRGRWKARLSWTQDGEPCYLEQDLFL